MVIRFVGTIAVALSFASAATAEQHSELLKIDLSQDAQQTSAESESEVYSDLSRSAILADP